MNSRKFYTTELPVANHLIKYGQKMLRVYLDDLKVKWFFVFEDNDNKCEHIIRIF